MFKKPFIILIVLTIIAAPLTSGPAFAQRDNESDGNLKFISKPKAKWISKHKCAIVWYTNYKSTGKVDFGKTRNYGRTNKAKAGFKHIVPLKNLESGTVYHFRVTASNDEEIIMSADKTFETMSPDIRIISVYPPKSFKLGEISLVKVITSLTDAPLGAHYYINVYRTAYTEKGEKLNKTPIKVGERKIDRHVLNTNQSIDVPVRVTPLPGLSEGFDRRNVFTVKAELFEKEKNIANNKAEFTAEVIH